MIFVLLAEMNSFSFIAPITGKFGAPQPETDIYERMRPYTANKTLIEVDLLIPYTARLI
jgi:hypothetical protein